MILLINARAFEMRVMTYLHVVETTSWHAWKIVGCSNRELPTQKVTNGFLCQSGNDRRAPQFLWQAVIGSHPTAGA
jgi:lipid-A-disaccharide synthase-like uncharacterized protein